MERLNGWESANSFGDFKVLKAGAYKCKILEATECKSKNGKSYISVKYDISEGEFKDFFKTKFDNDTRSDKKWSGIWNLFLGGYEPGSINSKFKGLITSIEKSNMGFIWDWNEKNLVNKFVGIVLREEEFIANDGSTKSSAKPFYAVPVSDLNTVKTPEAKTIENNNINTAVNETNSDFETYSGDDLPF